jgi:hypothetical protein
MVELRIAPTFAEAREIMAEDLSERSRALLAVALDLACWKRLSETCSVQEAAALMSNAIAALA